MRKKLLSIVPVLLLAACAVQSPRDPLGETQAEIDSAAVPGPGAGVASSGPAAAQVTTAAHPGYKTKIRKGETVYCKTVQPTGSLFPSEFCFTQAELDRQKQQKERLLNKPGGCRPPNCPDQ